MAKGQEWLSVADIAKFFSFSKDTYVEQCEFQVAQEHESMLTQ